MSKGEAFAGNNLTLYHTIWTYNDSENKAFETTVGKGENAGNLLFPQCFCNHSKNNFCYVLTFILSSENAFNLGQSKNFLYGIELIVAQTIEIVFNSLSNTKILYQTKLEVFAYNQIHVGGKLKCVLGWVKNIVGENEGTLIAFYKVSKTLMYGK